MPSPFIHRGSQKDSSPRFQKFIVLILEIQYWTWRWCKLLIGCNHIGCTFDHIRSTLPHPDIDFHYMKSNSLPSFKNWRFSMSAVCFWVLGLPLFLWIVCSCLGFCAKKLCFFVGCLDLFIPDSLSRILKGQLRLLDEARTMAPEVFLHGLHMISCFPKAWKKRCFKTDP